MNKDDDKIVRHNDGVKSPSKSRPKGVKVTSLASNDGSHDPKKQRHSAPPIKDRKSVREEKLAAALRDNLRRRKIPPSQQEIVEDRHSQTTPSKPTPSKSDQS